MLFVEHELALATTDAQRSLGVANCLLLASPFLKEAQGLLDEAQPFERRVVTAVQQRLHLSVGVAAHAADDRLGHPDVVALALFIEAHQDREGQPIALGDQRTKAVRERLGQHRNDLVGQIDARPARQRLVVESRSGTDVVSDVGDVHAKVEQAVVGTANGDRVVVVLGVISIDREDQVAAQVEPALVVRRAWIVRQVRRVGQDVLGNTVRTRKDAKSRISSESRSR